MVVARALALVQAFGLVAEGTTDWRSAFRSSTDYTVGNLLLFYPHDGQYGSNHEP